MDFGGTSSKGYVPAAATAGGAAAVAANASNLSSGTVPHARLDAAQFVSGVVSGHNGAGAITLAGAKVGDKVEQALNLTDDADARSSFESTITIAGQVQQSSAVDLSAKKFSFLLLSQS